MHSSWQDSRSVVATLKAGEKVSGITGVLVVWKPDRFLVKRPIAHLSPKAGGVILQYVEWEEGSADLWAKGVWYKSFDWGQTGEDGDLVLSDENVTLAESCPLNIDLCKAPELPDKDCETLKVSQRARLLPLCRSSNCAVPRRELPGSASPLLQAQGRRLLRERRPRTCRLVARRRIGSR